MPLIQYGQDLYKDLGDRKSNVKANPFGNWQLTRFTFKNKKYYLFVEIDTGMIIVTRRINKNEFNNVLISLNQTMYYLIPEQREKIVDFVFKTKFTLVHNDLIGSEVTNKVIDYTKNNVQDLEKKLDFDNKPELTKIDKLVAMSIALMTLASDDAYKTIEKIVRKASEVMPVKTKRPKESTKYWDLRMQFTDPDHWKKYENQDVSSNATIIDKIKQNNEKILDQYFKYAQISYKNYLVDPKKQLLDFTNNYLLVDKIHFVNSNLEDACYYIWWGMHRGIQSRDDLENDQKFDMLQQLFDMFEDFYLFLSRVGLIRQADAKRIKKYCQEQDDINFNGEDDSIDYEKLAEDIFEDPEKFREMAKDKNTPPKIANFINEFLFYNDLMLKREKINKSKNAVLENKKRNSATYEIRTKLRGFKPSTWRRFIISGNSSIETLEQAILLMFNVEWGHMYDLYNTFTGIRYENQRNIDAMNEWGARDSVNSEKAKVSIFNVGDKLLLTYDYGDNWKFEINIKRIDNSVVTPKYPHIISGKGLGIIEDIGGVWSLQDYYDTPESEMDPEMLDWMGGEKIDLDEFDKNDLNDALTHL